MRRSNILFSLLTIITVMTACTATDNLPADSSFGSGAGAWSTEVTVNSDGSFSGYYHDSDMGDSDDEYPNGTRYGCYFTGAFMNIQKIGEYEYSMEIDFINSEGIIGEAEIADGVRVILSEPYGLMNSKSAQQV